MDESALKMAELEKGQKAIWEALMHKSGPSTISIVDSRVKTEEAKELVGVDSFEKAAKSRL